LRIFFARRITHNARRYIFADYSAESAFDKGTSDVIMAIEIFAGDGKEAIAGFYSPRVGTYTGKKTVLVARAPWHVSLYYSGQICY
jgi:hypothetical protein